MEQDILFDNIDAYIWNLLSDEDRQAFEKTLETDDALRAELALRQLENEALQLADKADLRTKITAWRAEELAEKKTENIDTPVVPINPLRVVRFKPMQWAAAAAVALLFIVGGRYWATNNYGNEALASAFHEKTSEILRGPDDDVFGSSGTSKLDAAQALTDAKAAFDAKNYAQAITTYQSILAEKTVTPRYIQEAEWQLIVTYLAAKKTDSTSEFRILLDKLVNDSTHSYHKAALELNQKVNSVWWKWVN